MKLINNIKLRLITLSDSLSLIIPPLLEGGGGILFYIGPSVRPSSKIFFVAFFSVTVDGRNLIFGHNLHIFRFLLPVVGFYTH